MTFGDERVALAIVIRNMLEPIVKALVAIGDGVMNVFCIGHAAEKRIAKGGVVGKSKLDHETKRWHKRIMDTWVDDHVGD